MRKEVIHGLRQHRRSGMTNEKNKGGSPLAGPGTTLDEMRDVQAGDDAYCGGRISSGQAANRRQDEAIIGDVESTM